MNPSTLPQNHRIRMKELARSQIRPENKSCLIQWVRIVGGRGGGERRRGGEVERWGAGGGGGEGEEEQNEEEQEEE